MAEHIEEPVETQSAVLEEAPESRRAEGQQTPTVFVSYRVDPDQPLAEALKDLLEGALDPPPHVFVSGAGGLRPSALPYPTQLQQAARAAEAFLGVITKASKDRAWIHFEAGAAWGRNRMYAPVLVDVAPSELESTIGIYQATRSLDEEGMRILIEDLAAATRSAVRPRFGPRYAAFTRAVSRYTEGSAEVERKDADAPVAIEGDGQDAVEAAAFLLTGERRQEGDARLVELAQSANPDVASYARIARIAFDFEKEPTQRLARLESLSGDDRRHLEYSAWHGMLDPDPRQAVADLVSYMEASGPKPSVHIVLRRLIALRLEAGHQDEALTEVRKALLSGDRSLRESGARLYCELWPSAEPVSRLAAVVLGLMAEHSVSLLRVGTDLANEQKWRSLAVYFARRRSKAEEDSGSSLNAVGISLDGAGLFSAAYEAYKTSAAQGVS